MRKTHAPLAFSLVALVFTAGCGDKTYPVQGQVVFEDDAPAQELAGYTIMFQSQKHKTSANGTIQPDGSFTVGTFKDGDGAMLGAQRVAITPPIAEPEKPIPRPVIDKKYGEFETSLLAVEIKPERNKVTVKVERIRK